MKTFYDIIKKSSLSKIVKKDGSAIVDKAKELMEAKTYHESNKPLYYLAKVFSGAYHLLSYAIACLSIFVLLYIATKLNIYLIAIIAIVSCCLLFAIEYSKAHASRHVFSQIARKDKVDHLLILMLIFCTIFSMLTSVGGAYYGIKNYSNDLSETNSATSFNSQKDSLLNLYASQKAAIDLVINSNKEILTSGKIANWQKNISTEKIATANKELETIQSKEAQLVSTLQANSNSNLDVAKNDNLVLASLIGLCFLLFECFNLLSYFYIYYFAKRVVLECDINNDKGTSNDNPKPKPKYTIDTTPKPKPKNVGFAYASQGKNSKETATENSKETATKNSKDSPKAAITAEKPPFNSFETASQTANSKGTNGKSNGTDSKNATKSKYPTAKCGFCNKEFLKTKHNKRYCNKECKKSNQALVDVMRLKNK